MIAPRRPLLRWHGGKWRLARWIVEHFPEHLTYVEPFGGAASVLLRKPRSRDEIYNDLDDDVVNLFRVLRSPDAARLVETVRLTPFARSEFLAAYECSADPLEEARRLIVRSFMGFGSDAPNREVTTGFRTVSRLSNKSPARDWASYPSALEAVIERLNGVAVEHRPALDVMRRHDTATTLHYVDPPYMPSTRSQKSRRGGARYHVYKHELTAADHLQLLTDLRQLEGMVVLSGYPTALYDAELHDWHRVERSALADGARARIEVLWVNPAAVQQLEKMHAEVAAA